MTTSKVKSFGTAPVFCTAISTILGAILFLRFGYATGMLGFFGVILVIILGHLVTIPTALALSEIATNQRVEGGGEYFIISRSFGLNIGATIGISLYMSQAISVAFYIIAFTEAFEPIFILIAERFNMILPRQVISIPAMLGLSWLILKKGASMGVRTLYVVIALLFISLFLFFIGKTAHQELGSTEKLSLYKDNLDQFFYVFAIVFPAFTGMTAGVGLSGDLKKPGKSIPLGTTLATVIGMIVYIFIAWKLAVSASRDELIENQLIMSNIALLGVVIIPLGLAASTISSALGSIMVAPRTLQALGSDRSLPGKRINSIMGMGRGKTREPFNATLLTCIIALVFVAMGNVNAVAKIISMFFMVTYGSLCLISFLYHFGADPSYRPIFRSRWYISFLGFVMCVYLMFKIDAPYAIAAIILMTLIYILISYSHKERRGLQDIFQAFFFQLSRQIQVYLQKSKKSNIKGKWRPSALCVSANTFERENALQLLEWISNKYGFGTYIHLIEDYLSVATHEKSRTILNKLIELTDDNSNVYLDTLVSPTFTSAIAQIIQLPSISGMENNMIIFEFEKDNPGNLEDITKNIPLARAANLDICILGSSRKRPHYKGGIHVWIRSIDINNSNLMILLSYIILGHPAWKKAQIKIFDICKEGEIETKKDELLTLIQTGRLPISPKNIEIIKLQEDISIKTHVNNRSNEAGLVVIGFNEEQIKHNDPVFDGYEKVGDLLFVNASNVHEIN